MAADWKKVETPGIGPRAFAQQNFGTKEWKNLIGEDGTRINNPATDLKFGKKYTIEAKEQSSTTEA